MLDRHRQPFHAATERRVRQHDSRPFQRRVAHLVDALWRRVGYEADVQRVADVYVVGEPAREIQGRDAIYRKTVVSQCDVLPAVVGRLRLRQRRYVGARQCHVSIRRERELPSAVAKRAQLVHQPRASKLSQQVHEARSTDALRRRVADSADERLAVPYPHRLHRAIVARHPVSDLSALERRPRRTRRRDQSLPVADDDLGVGADVNQHHVVFSLVHAHRKHIRRHVRAHVTADERPPVNVSVREHADARLPRRRAQRRRVAHPGARLALDDRPVRLLAYRLHVQAEQHIAHRRVAHHDHLVYAPPVEAKLPRHVADLEVDGRNHHLSKLAVELASVVRDAVHDVAAAEPLRILERSRMRDAARLQVNQVHDHSRRADVYRKPIDRAAIVVYAPSLEYNRVAVSNGQRLQRDAAAYRVRQDARLAAQNRELYVRARLRHRSLAGQPVVRPAQKALSGCRRIQRVRASLHFDDALMALARPPARRRNSYPQRVGIIEYGSADRERQRPISVVQWHNSRYCSRFGVQQI